MKQQRPLSIFLQLSLPLPHTQRPPPPAAPETTLAHLPLVSRGVGEEEGKEEENSPFSAWAILKRPCAHVLHTHFLTHFCTHFCTARSPPSPHIFISLFCFLLLIFFISFLTSSQSLVGVSLKTSQNTVSLFLTRFQPFIYYFSPWCRNKPDRS